MGLPARFTDHAVIDSVARSHVGATVRFGDPQPVRAQSATPIFAIPLRLSHTKQRVWIKQNGCETISNRGQNDRDYVIRRRFDRSRTLRMSLSRDRELGSESWCAFSRANQKRLRAQTVCSDSHPGREPLSDGSLVE